MDLFVKITIFLFKIILNLYKFKYDQIDIKKMIF